MAPVDDCILEHMEQEGPVLLQDVHAAVKANCDAQYNRAELANRMERLLHYRLVASVGRTRFYLTEFGAKYLNGALEASALQPKGHPKCTESSEQLIE
jgi:hypothetical protein